MAVEPFRTLTAKTKVIAVDNVDTDQIIPARFLTTTASDGLGRCAFHDWRFDEGGTRLPTDPFGADDMADTPILVAGANFGCGSSREHAPWALRDFGFRAVISSDIADIFKSNALKNGLLAVEVGQDVHAHLLQNGGCTLTLDLEQRVLTLDTGERIAFEVEAFARRCLLDGVDTLGYLLGQQEAIRAYEEARQ